MVQPCKYQEIGLDGGYDIGAVHRGLELLGVQGYTAIREYQNNARQKLSIIKAFLKSPDILFLDEPSSALDENSVNVLKQEIINLKNNRIIIIISHDNRIRDIVDEIVTI